MYRHLHKILSELALRARWRQIQGASRRAWWCHGQGEQHSRCRHPAATRRDRVLLPQRCVAPRSPDDCKSIVGPRSVRLALNQMRLCRNRSGFCGGAYKTAMVLAAGRGKRMRPLTETVPKPLLPVCGRPLLDYHLERLAQAGVERVVINGAWLREQIEAYVQRGFPGLELIFSPEPEGGLETAGGILQALPVLGSEPFIVVNGDVFTDFPFQQLPPIQADKLAHLVLVPSPSHNLEGDFGLEGEEVIPHGPYTFSGISVLRPQLFAEQNPGFAPLAPLLRKVMSQHTVTGQFYDGMWWDIGTPARLKALEKTLRCA